MYSHLLHNIDSDKSSFYLECLVDVLKNDENIIKGLVKGEVKNLVLEFKRIVTGKKDAKGIGYFFSSSVLQKVCVLFK